MMDNSYNEFLEITGLDRDFIEDINNFLLENMVLFHFVKIF